MHSQVKLHNHLVGNLSPSSMKGLHLTSLTASHLGWYVDTQCQTAVLDIVDGGARSF